MVFFSSTEGKSSSCMLACIPPSDSLSVLLEIERKILGSRTVIEVGCLRTHDKV